MDNQKKLELTLCGMFSYKLKIQCDNTIWTLDKLDRPYKTNDKLFLNIGCRYDEKGFPLTQKSFISEKHEFKPLLHSLEKLTEPILEGGLIPIVELLKIIHPKEDYTSKYGLISVSEVGHPCAWYTYSANFSLTIWLNDLEKTPFWIIEKLKEWHFNIYDLPKEMYIEKSEVK